jgi:RNA recognition motif. (a.k.a. RRM, RBD, or RNP domain)
MACIVSRVLVRPFFSPQFPFPFLLVRISPATAKYKSALSSAEFGAPFQEADPTPRTEQSPPPSNVQSHSVSTPLASTSVTSPSTSGPSPEDVHSQPKSTNNRPVRNSVSTFAAEYKQAMSSQRYVLSEESWKHHAQARAILSNLIGPNGEQLSSSDPYNTTVFVGGLSPLISEDTLRTFFVPFGEIHYVSTINYQLPCLLSICIFRSRFLLARIAALSSSCESQMPKGPSKKCKAFPLVAVGLD